VATEEYHATLTIEHKIKSDLLTINDLERVMTEEYRQLTRNQVFSSVQDKEILLFQILEACCNCGKFGHCANECTSRKSHGQNQTKNTRFQGKCGTCGIRSRTSKDCWTREENKDKRPTNQQKPSKEKAVIVVKSKKNGKIIEYG
jgi:hypothetical protein